MRGHIQRMHGNIVFSCDECEHKCNSIDKLNRHKKDKHSNILVPCSECNFKAVSTRSLRDHNRKHIQCKYCLKKFGSQVKRNHRLGFCKIEKETTEIKCIMCPFFSKSVDVLKMHALSHQSDAAKILEELPQSLKEVSFGTKEQFNADLDEFLGKSRFKTQIDEFILRCLSIIVECPECGKTMTKKSLKRHKEKAHLQKEEREINVTNKHIKIHEETAHLKKEEKEKICLLMTVECPECGKTVTKKHLKRHKETSHLKLKRKQPLGQCKECGKNLLRDSIGRHMRTVHKETKEYEDK